MFQNFTGIRMYMRDQQYRTIWVGLGKHLRIFRIRFQTLKLIILSFFLLEPVIILSLRILQSSIAEISSTSYLLWSMFKNKCLVYQFKKDADTGGNLSRSIKESIPYGRTGTNNLNRITSIFFPLEKFQIFYLKMFVL